MTEAQVAIALIVDRGRCFLQRRDPGNPRLPGLWEFPGGKLEPFETPEAALLRELAEELRWAPIRTRALAPLRHEYPGLAVTLHPFRCEGRQAPRTGLAWGWFTLEEWSRLPMPEANRGLITVFSEILP